MCRRWEHAKERDQGGGLLQPQAPANPGVWPRPGPFDGHAQSRTALRREEPALDLAMRLAFPDPLSRGRSLLFPPLLMGGHSRRGSQTPRQGTVLRQGPSFWQRVLTRVSILPHLVTSLGTNWTIQLSCYKPNIYFKRNLHHNSRWITSLTGHEHDIITK